LGFRHATGLPPEVPPVLRYGKYCGILYSGCPGEKPCDALDACCMVHDHCVAANNSTISSPSSTHFSSSIYLNRKDRTGGKHVRFPFCLLHLTSPPKCPTDPELSASCQLFTR
uniref:Uncharacterized protein n=1 Tax=Aegilops tauschii subsp. strangulata TaxID=200361 RepID=A0A453IG73_AEGTS